MNEVNLRTARPPRSLQRNDSACAMAHKPLLLTLSAQSSTLFSGNLNLFCTTEVSSLILLPFSPNHTKIKQIQKDLFLVKNKKQIQQVCKYASARMLNPCFVLQLEDLRSHSTRELQLHFFRSFLFIPHYMQISSYVEHN